jgi:DNA-3-methyladenine glycosylase
MARRLQLSFFARPVDRVARELIGVTLAVEGCGGVIVETESYDTEDAASHAFEGRRTARNATMFGPPGRAYVYLSYGMHWCLNFTCGAGSAVLIRALQPTLGLERMAERRGLSDEKRLCAGPGRLCQALGITGAMNGAPLLRPPFALFEAEAKASVLTGTRIGITKARDLPRRFGMKGSKFLSKTMRE